VASSARRPAAGPRQHRHRYHERGGQPDKASVAEGSILDLSGGPRVLPGLKIWGLDSDAGQYGADLFAVVVSVIERLREEAAGADLADPPSTMITRSTSIGLDRTCSQSCSACSARPLNRA
jgi:hypothetical protein